ncbi:DUF3533 domain-containing protein [Streptomyces sp. SID13666]|uniref:DUF3533 domain-containing protein n=1 Tax=unclassified Streptomyces TaxID=2593676 RepID=UPI0013C0409B|nr:MULTISPECIES: DUF3533 domain-containing protein [unclassified Streptomyces]NEA55826.1 DUF3533 domain-containing protein [Streptomyces sp. SID13666]NEA71292.1 DUF3533 domain-containing protein [Streptomyces sp. SID13588]
MSSAGTTPPPPDETPSTAQDSGSTTPDSGASRGVPALPDGSGGFAAELRDAISFRAFLLVVGGLLIQLAFIVSYLGAFHSPTPHRIPAAVVAPAQVAGKVAAQLNGLPGEPVKAVVVADEAEARRQIMNRTVDAAILINPAGKTDSLLVASAGGPSVSQTAAQIAQSVEKTQHRQVTVTDIKAPNKEDGRGLSSFYLVIGWVVGGYLTASILGVAGGARPVNRHRTAIRLGTLALFSVVSGLGGAIIVDPVFSALTGHFVALWAIGALVVFAAAAVTTALQTLFGIIGIGLSILLFVVMGNPSAGGVYPASLLPRFWSAIGQSLPPGAGTTAVRNTVYFGGSATAGPLWVLAAYAVAGVVVAMATVVVRDRRAGAGTAGAADPVTGAVTPG